MIILFFCSNDEHLRYTFFKIHLENSLNQGVGTWQGMINFENTKIQILNIFKYKIHYIFFQRYLKTKYTIVFSAWILFMAFLHCNPFTSWSLSVCCNDLPVNNQHLTSSGSQQALHPLLQHSVMRSPYLAFLCSLASSILSSCGDSRL